MTTTRRLKIVVDQEGDAGQGLGRISGVLGGLGKVAGIAAGGLAVLGGATVTAGAYLVGLGSEAEEMQAKFDVVFGDTAASVTDSLDQFGNAVGRNKYELMGMASVLGDTLKPMGFTGQALQDTSVDLVKLATDLSSFNNMPMDEALSRLRGTLVGAHQNALAFGVVINENTLKQELMRMGADKLTGAELEQAKVQARINLLMRGTADAQGDAARTSGSWANQMRGLKAQLTEAATTMGTQLLPVVTPFLQTIVQMAQDIMPQAVEIFAQFAAELQANAGPAMMMVNDALTRIAQAFGVNTEQVSATDVILGTFKAVLDAVIIAIQAGAIALQGIAWAVEKTSEAVHIAIGLWNQLKIIAGAAIGNIRGKWASVSNFVRSGVNGWRSAFSSVGGAISALVGRFQSMASAAQNAANSIPDWLRPGSPTPFEMGLRGIAKASRDVESRLPAAFAQAGGLSTGAGFAAAGAGGAPVQVIVQYSPVVSTANQLEIERNLVPLILRGLRKAGVKVSG